jgi:hypothetical protein
MALPLIPIIFCLLIIGIIVFLYGKRQSAGKKGIIIKRILKPYEKYWNLDECESGRIAGEHGLEEIGENTLVRYSTGMLQYPPPRQVATDQIIRIHPPLCKDPEGWIVVLPSDPKSPFADHFPHIMKIVTLRSQIRQLNRRIYLLGRIIETGESKTTAIQEIKKISEIATHIKSGLEKTEKETALIETAGIKEEKPKTQPQRQI